MAYETLLQAIEERLDHHRARFAAYFAAKQLLSNGLAQAPRFETRLTHALIERERGEKVDRRRNPRQLSAAAKLRISQAVSAAQKKRWAKWKREQRARAKADALVGAGA